MGYSVALTSQPSSDVVVRVEVEIILHPKGVTCIHQDERLQLVTTDVVFTAGNYDVLQEVVFRLRRNETYQGPLLASFSHTVETDDLQWKSALSRSVSLTLIDDDDCPDGAAQFEGIDQVRKCQCLQGYYLAEDDPSFCGSALTCIKCPTGLHCDAMNQDLTMAVVDPGLYRTSAQSTTVVTCPQESACVGGIDASDSLCAEGHEGPMCQVCQDTYVWDGDACVVCDSGKEASVYATFAVALVMFAGSAGFILRGIQQQNKKMSREEKRVLRHKQRVWSKVANGVQTKYKTLVRFLSVFSRVAVLYPYTMPETFAEQFEKVNFLASLDVALLPVGCLVKTSFHDRLLVVCLVPLVFVACVGLVALLNAVLTKYFVLEYPCRLHILYWNILTG
jgi:hypothetical protein